MPATAKEFHLEISKDIDERLDPIKSTKAAIEYLKYLHKRFGKWYLATLAYNCGETKLAKVLREVPNDNLSTLIDDELKYLPTETRNYMRRIVIAAMLAYDNEIIIKNDADHLFGNCTNSKLIEVFFNGGSTLNSIAQKVGISLEKIKNCNPHLLKEKVPEDKESYHVYLPEEFVKDLNSSKITVGRFTYKIQDGDTVSKISKKYNIKMSTIYKLNPSIRTILNVGQHITLIGENKVIDLNESKNSIVKDIKKHKDLNSTKSKTFIYRVKDGDSISQISQRYHIKVSKIRELNPTIKTILMVGQKLTLPKHKAKFPYITEKLKQLQGE
jgi:membrane-bound lytic murein transglycosylase D